MADNWNKAGFFSGITEDYSNYHWYKGEKENPYKGKRYRRQDEIGTPFCVTYDFDSEEDHCVTVRDRDTMEQERIAIDELDAYFAKKFEF